MPELLVRDRPARDCRLRADGRLERRRDGPGDRELRSGELRGRTVGAGVVDAGQSGDVPDSGDRGTTAPELLRRDLRRPVRRLTNAPAAVLADAGAIRAR